MLIPSPPAYPSLRNLRFPHASRPLYICPTTFHIHTLRFGSDYCNMSMPQRIDLGDTPPPEGDDGGGGGVPRGDLDEQLAAMHVVLERQLTQELSLQERLSGYTQGGGGARGSAPSPSPSVAGGLPPWVMGTDRGGGIEMDSP